MPSTTNQSTNIQGSFFNIDPKRFLHDLLRYWWIFAITLPISILSVYMMHRYIVPVYGASISLLLEERGEKGTQTNMMEGFGLTPGQQNVENQMAILTSWDIVQRTIDQLDFHVSYFISGHLKETEIYDNPSYWVEFDSIHPQLLNTPINITYISKDEYKLSVNTETASTYIYKNKRRGPKVSNLAFEQVYKFGEKVTTAWASFTITNRYNSFNSDQELYFLFNHPGSIAATYKSKLRAYRTNETSSIVRVSLSGTNRAKNITFLNKLAEVFIANNLAQKNQIATNTIKFIEEQLTVISDTLHTTGSQLSQFRTNNRIQSVSAKADYLFTGLQDMEQQLAQHEITRRYFLYLKEYFSQDLSANEVIAPALYQTDNGLLNDQIRQIMELNSQRMGLRESYSEVLNPANKDLENQISIATMTLLKTINSQLEIIDRTVQRINENKADREQELYQLPETERRLLGIERKFELSNEVYTFLLRKRSESQIQKASNTPDHQVLEAAKHNGQISPNAAGDRKKAFLVGLILPLAFIGLRQILNNKIIDHEDVEQITSLPILGQILHNTKEESNVVRHHPKSVITETFRRVRTRLDFMNEGKACPVIGVTSSMPGEGKTFCAMNMAAALAISGKRTVLLGFDLRKPGLNKLIESNGQMGISNYLIGQAEYDEIKMMSGQENLTIIPTGDIPPNPSELVSSEKTKELINKLKEEFDTIILDTPPMGIVSDPYLLARHTDTLVFLVRQNHTIKKILGHTLKNIQDEGITNVGILLNDVNVKKGRYAYSYNYGYGYGYRYGQGYYED
ncbi:polysaccharide biosynthesis tyrosine autokinase [Carboxylicivirga sp. N1Y90]|uniref:polysaccharide biosynthesis tyrosine autokinase n=1 Tax=Carboxylicivirga fragile TaxID=3417571 RepID=UPI003D34A943|nr:polysaccharide biosynthesis tyrosine autokinase [Marinilabiliaceae bacterium N1Y90]